MSDTNFANDYYNDLLPQLLEWKSSGYTQQAMCDFLNRAGRINSVGRPYTQDTISKLLKRTRQRQIA